jgi:drug/metabolite transporter (DMT)-like permease
MDLIDLPGRILFKCSEIFESTFGKYSGLSYMILQAFFFSVQNLFTKFVPDVPSFTIAFGRGISMYLVNLISINKNNDEPYPKDSHINKLLILRGLFGFLQMAAVLFGMKFISMLEVITIYNLYPIVVLFCGSFFLKEPFTKRELIAAIISFGGFLFIVRPAFIFGSWAKPNAAYDESDRTLGIMVSITSVFSMTATVICMRDLKQNVSPIVNMQYYGLACTLLSPIGMLFQPNRFMTIEECFNMFVIVFMSFLGEISRTRGLQLEKAGKSSILNYLMVFFCFIWEITVLRENANYLSFFGTGLIFLGAFFLF